MKLYTLFIAATIFIYFTACNTATQTGNATHTSQNSLDWAGTYIGTLPCADCEGIRTILTISDNNTYILQEVYLSKSDSIFTSEGNFSWSENGQIIQLQNGEKEQFFVGENQLFRLDTEGNRIETDLEDNYRLVKTNTGLVEKYWKLIELRGESIKPTTDNQREMHIILKQENYSLIGFAGCNRLNGTYELQEEQGRISLSNIATTKMACPDLEKETQFLEILHSVDNYTVSGDTLSLNKARMAPLAKFQVVYLR